MPSKLEKKSTTRKFSTLSEKREPSPKTPQPANETEDYVDIPIGLITIDSNIRTTYDEEEIASLAESIKAIGQQEAIKVYEENNQYVIIFGHRRYLAHKKAGLPTIKCVIRSKPDTLEKIYIQIAENEHSANISFEDREKYIKMLKDDYNQTVEEITQKTGKKKTWVYTCLKAPEVREKHGKAFSEAGVTLSTFDTKQIANANEEEIAQALEEVTVDPNKKTEALKQVNKKVTERRAKAKKRITQKLPDEDDFDEKQSTSFFEDSDFTESSLESKTPVPKTSAYKGIMLGVHIGIYRDTKNITIKLENLGDDYDDDLINFLKEKITSYYKEKGYTIDK